MSARASAYAKALVECPNGERISPREKLVLIVLADNHQDKARHFTYPSIETIAEDALCDRRSCQRYLASLERKGVIRRLRPPKQGAGMTVFYFFAALDQIPEGWQAAALFSPGGLPKKGGKRAAEGRQKGGSACIASITNINPNEELKTKQPPNPPQGRGAAGEDCASEDCTAEEFTAEELDHLARCRERGEDTAKWERYYREGKVRRAELDAAAARDRLAFPNVAGATETVMRVCGFVLGARPERNPLPKVLTQVMHSQELLGAPPWVTGPRMIQCWFRLQGTRDGPRWGPLKFFRDGVWLSFAGSEGARG